MSHPEFHNTSNFLAEANAARAMDATRHFLGGNKRAHGLVKDDTLGLAVMRSRRAVAHSEILQLAFTALVADGAVKRMINKQEFHNALLCKLGLLRGRKHFHTRGNGRCTGG